MSRKGPSSRRVRINESTSERLMPLMAPSPNRMELSVGTEKNQSLALMSAIMKSMPFARASVTSAFIFSPSSMTIQRLAAKKDAV